MYALYIFTCTPSDSLSIKGTIAPNTELTSPSPLSTTFAPPLSFTTALCGKRTQANNTPHQAPTLHALEG